MDSEMVHHPQKGRDEAKAEAKRLWKAGAGRNEIARRTGLPRSTITRWSKVWGAQEQPEKPLDPVTREEERLRTLAMGTDYQVPETVHLYSEDEREIYLSLLEEANGDHTRIARESSGGRFKLLPPPPPPLSTSDRYALVFGSRRSREQTKRRLLRKRLKAECDYYGATHPPGYRGE